MAFVSGSLNVQVDEGVACGSKDERVCLVNVTKACKRVLHVLEVVFATPTIDHRCEPELRRRLYKYHKVIERTSRKLTVTWC
jgi:hypothetical protein